MVFACQTDSFKRDLVTKVVSCTRVTLDKDDFYEVICEDSILFPEGGGQPYDKGFINCIPVHQVLRRGDQALIYTKEPLEVGQEVNQEIDWERRLDHMQQHSGQHLITAVLTAEYNIDTTSWWLGEKVSHIELDTPKLSDEQIQRTEKLVNEKIFEQVPVRVKLCELGDKDLQEAKTRGLPDDVVGPVRIVEIVGLENNMCCGTHVNNLIQLQCIKLLYAEKGKKNKTNLFFLSGVRVLKYLTECLDREQKMMKLLKNEPSAHVDLVEKLQVNLKLTNKKLVSAQKELAAFEANKFSNITPKPQYFFYYNKDGDNTFIDNYLRILKENNSVGETLFVLATGEDSGNGFLVLQGNPEAVKEIGPKMADVMVGKGAAHGTRFQAKVSKVSNFTKAQECVKEYFKNIG